MSDRQKTLFTALGSVSSWADLQKKWSSYTAKEKGDRFEELTQAYLQSEPEYLTKLKHVWRLEEVPVKVAQKLNLPATDKGIDLVAQTHEGEFWAIQCKYRQETNQQLTHTDISTFTSLTFQACKGFSFALVCSTTERVTSLYRDEERIGFCALDVWQSLDQGFFNSLRDKLTDKVVKLEPRTEFPHQSAAVKDGVEYFVKQKSTRGKLIMPCGSGKSLTAWFLSQALKSKRIVIAVPSLSLVKQTLKVWLRESVANNIDVEWICVCSDETAGRADQDDVVVQRQDIAVPCLTSTDKIADWLKGKHKGLTVVFTTYQSGNVLATAARKAKFVFDLGIMDEAHKTVGDEDKQFSILLHDHNVEISKRVFMTATERRYKGSSDKVLSMENMEVYGDTFHQLSFKQAMEAEKPILCDYNIITIGVSRQEIKELIQKNVFVRPTSGKWDEELEADMLAAMVALRKAMKEHPIKHAVSFHGSIQRAEIFRAHNDTFTKQFPEFGNLETFHVSGKTPTGTRSNIIRTFAQAERSLITNARCLTEGVDVPGIDCVLFADPRKSTVDIVQAVGRALRPSEGKKLGYVIIPILHDTDATSEQLIESGAFKEVLSTLSALAANDDRIIEYFRGISQGRNPSGLSRVSFEMDERIAKRIDIDKLVQDLEIKCWNRLAKLSWRPFQEARKFAHLLNLKSETEWRKYSHYGIPGLANRPMDIPAGPASIYKMEGWAGWGDWLGTGNIAKRLRVWRPYDDARHFACQLGLKGEHEWRLYLKGKISGKVAKPSDIPSSPDNSYKNKGWIDWSDWLGTPKIMKGEWRPYEQALSFVNNLKIKSQSEWIKYCRGESKISPSLPADIPRHPAHVYSDSGWTSWGDWLGTGRIADQNKIWRPYNEAIIFVHKLNLKTAEEWSKYCKYGLKDKPSKPEDIPATPMRSYSGLGWKNIGEWLGTKYVASYKRNYLPLKDAKNFVHSLKLKSHIEWTMYCKGEMVHLPPKPEDIPRAADQVYANKGWVSWSDFIGTSVPLRNFVSARLFARSLGLKNILEWRDYVNERTPNLPKLPADIPSNPNEKYRKLGWDCWGDWLGTDFRSGKLKKFRDYDSARQYVHYLKLKSYKEWRLFTKGTLLGMPSFPDDIPTAPNIYYKKYGQWKDWYDWLGTQT